MPPGAERPVFGHMGRFPDLLSSFWPHLGKPAKSHLVDSNNVSDPEALFGAVLHIEQA
jgi:hypothetical protein